MNGKSPRRPGGARTVDVFDPAVFRGDRLDAGLSLSALARLAGTCHMTLSYWESGRTQPTARVYRRVLAVLLDAEEQSPPDWLWRRHWDGVS